MRQGLVVRNRLVSLGMILRNRVHSTGLLTFQLDFFTDAEQFSKAQGNKQDRSQCDRPGNDNKHSQQVPSKQTEWIFVTGIKDSSFLVEYWNRQHSPDTTTEMNCREKQYQLTHVAATKTIYGLHCVRMTKKLENPSSNIRIPEYFGVTYQPQHPGGHRPLNATWEYSKQRMPFPQWFQ